MISSVAVFDLLGLYLLIVRVIMKCNLDIFACPYFGRVVLHRCFCSIIGSS